jgi:hypothetical protein
MGEPKTANAGAADNMLMIAASGIWKVRDPQMARMLHGATQQEREKGKPSAMVHHVTQRIGREILEQVPTPEARAEMRRNLGFYELSANGHGVYPQITDAEIDMAARAMTYLGQGTICSHAACVHHTAVWLLKLKAQATAE